MKKINVLIALVLLTSTSILQADILARATGAKTCLFADSATETFYTCDGATKVVLEKKVSREETVSFYTFQFLIRNFDLNTCTRLLSANGAETQCYFITKAEQP